MLPAAESLQIILPIASILFLALALKNPIYGVISYFIVLNAKLGDMYPILGAIRFEFLVAVFVFIAIFISGKGFVNLLPNNNPINKAFWILFLVGMLSMALSIDPGQSWNIGGYSLLKLALFYSMIVMTIHSSSDLKKLLWAFVAVAAWLAYEPVTNYVVGAVTHHGYGAVSYGRFGAATGHVALANTMNQSIPITLYLAITTKNKYQKAILVLVLLMLCLGVYVTKSRGGFLGLIVIGLGVVFFAQARSKATLTVILAALVFFSIAGSSYVGRMSTIADGIYASRSSSDRYLGLVNGISMMIKRPILGVGPGYYADARRLYFNYYFYSHNLYGELFGELGLASIAWFAWIFVALKRSSLLKKMLDLTDYQGRFYSNILCAIQLGLVVRLFLGNFTHGWYIWFWFMMAAFVVGIENIIANEKEHNIAIPR